MENCTDKSLASSWDSNPWNNACYDTLSVIYDRTVLYIHRTNLFILFRYKQKVIQAIVVPADHCCCAWINIIMTSKTKYANKAYICLIQVNDLYFSLLFPQRSHFWKLRGICLQTLSTVQVLKPSRIFVISLRPLAMNSPRRAGSVALVIWYSCVYENVSWTTLSYYNKLTTQPSGHA